MDNNINELKKLLSKGLFLNNLSEMMELCSDLLKRIKEPLPLYVILSILDDIYLSWDDRCLTTDEFKRTEAILLPHLKKVVATMESLSEENWEKLWNVLDGLVKAYTSWIEVRHIRKNATNS